MKNFQIYIFLIFFSILILPEQGICQKIQNGSSKPSNNNIKDAAEKKKLEELKKRLQEEQASKMQKEDMEESGFQYETYIYQTLKKYHLFSYVEDSIKIQYSNLSEVSKETFKKMAQNGCNCLKENNDSLSNTLSKINLIFADTSKSIDKKGLMRQVKKMDPFLTCFENVNPSESENASSAIQNDLKKITTSANSEYDIQFQLLYHEIIKKCPENRNLLDNFLILNRRILETVR